jgi:hypothetical protein
VEAAADPGQRWWVKPWPSATWVPPVVTIVCIASVIVVTLWQLHPSLLLSSSTTTGGDNGGHYALPAFLNTGLLPHGQLTGWDPAWYDGFPLYTYYFILPDLFIALASHVIPYGLAFKWGVISGSVLLPVCAWAMGRLFGMRRAFPASLAAITLCYLFDYTYTIDGGNLFSTLAGEYSYSLSIAMALLFLGLFARGIRTGRHRGWTAVVLTVCILAHIVPALFAVVGAVLLIAFEMLPERLALRDAWLPDPTDPAPLPALGRRGALWWGGSTLGVTALLTGFWWVPFGLEQSLSNSMGYVNVRTFVLILLPAADRWALYIAFIAAAVAIVTRSRFGVLMSILAGLSALAVIYDPQATLYNTRFLPLWWLAIYLLAGWGIASLVTGVCDLVARYRASGSVGAHVADGSSPDEVARRGAPWPVAAVVGPLVTLFVALAVVVTPFVFSLSTLQSIGITPGPNQVTNWSYDNFSGYEAKPAYPEYRAVIQTMEAVSRTHGCGQAMWQYDPSLNRFGTTMALMLLPYWSNGCVGSMEGLLFESSSTTPYHFLNQAELSVTPSEAQSGLDYTTLDVTEGIQHLQLLGVKYFMASSPQVQAAASADPSLVQVGSTGPWTSCCYGTTAATTTTWKIYEVLHAPVVQPLTDLPAVQRGIGEGQSSWLAPSESWYDQPSRWNVELAADGPSNWPRVPIGDPDPPRHATAPTTVTDINQSDNQISFHVSRVGTPVLVKVSYFPNWQASGATGPYRVTPNLMVVVPTSHDVTLHYGRTTANDMGQFLTLLGVLALVAGVAVPRLRHRPAARDGEAPAAT